MRFTFHAIVASLLLVTVLMYANGAAKRGTTVFAALTGACGGVIGGVVGNGYKFVTGEGLGWLNQGLGWLIGNGSGLILLSLTATYFIIFWRRAGKDKSPSRGLRAWPIGQIALPPIALLLGVLVTTVLGIPVANFFADLTSGISA